MAGESDLIAAIYDAVVEPSGWDEVVRRVVEATKSVAGGLLIQHTDTVHLSATHNRDPFYVNAYVETWHKHHPLLCVTATALPGELRTATYITQTDTFRALAFFNEYVRPQQHADYIAVGLLNGPNSLGHLILNRSPDAVWVEPKEWNVLETLAPH